MITLKLKLELNKSSFKHQKFFIEYLNSIFQMNKTPTEKGERNRIHQLQLTKITIQIKSFLVLMMKSLGYTLILVPSRKKCKQLPDVTNFFIRGFFQDERTGDENYFDELCYNIQDYLNKDQRDYVVKRYADFKMIEIIVQFIQTFSIPMKEKYKKSHYIKLGSIVRIKQVKLNEHLKQFIKSKMMNYFTDQHELLKIELNNGILNSKNIELLGELFYRNELKSCLESHKKFNGLNNIIY